jgi:hypothetical protein
MNYHYIFHLNSHSPKLMNSYSILFSFSLYFFLCFHLILHHFNRLNRKYNLLFFFTIVYNFNFIELFLNFILFKKNFHYFISNLAIVLQFINLFFFT